jgi:hypothetical protein
VSSVAPSDINLMGVGKALRVVVCGEDPQDDSLASANEGTIQIDIHSRGSGERAG